MNWGDLRHAHRGARIGREIPADTVDRRHQLGEAQQGVATAIHRRGAGMGAEADDFQLVPALPLCGGHDADVEVFRFQNRPLFDVQLEGGVDRHAAHRMLTGVADAFQRLTEADAMLVAARQAVLEIEYPGEHPGGDHRRREARAFFVGPVDHFNCAFGDDLPIVKAANNLQPGQHAVDAVETATLGLRVAVRTGDHRRQLGPRAFAAQEHVAHPIDAHAATSLQCPETQLVARQPVSSLSARRVTPLSAMAPNCAMASRLCHRRSPLTRYVIVLLPAFWRCSGNRSRGAGHDGLAALQLDIRGIADDKLAVACAGEQVADFPSPIS